MTIEVSRTGSPYFDRAICFVKPEFSQLDKLDLHKAATRLVYELDAGVESYSQGDSAPEPEQTKVRKWLPFAVSAAGGVAAGILLGVIF